MAHENSRCKPCDTKLNTNSWGSPEGSALNFIKEAWSSQMRVYYLLSILITTQRKTKQSLSLTCAGLQAPVTVHLCLSCFSGAKWVSLFHKRKEVSIEMESPHSQSGKLATVNMARSDSPNYSFTVLIKLLGRLIIHIEHWLKNGVYVRGSLQNTERQEN